MADLNHGLDSPQPLFSPDLFSRAKAEHYGVPHAIHARDYIFLHSLALHKQLPPVVDYYFDDGHASAGTLDALVRTWHASHATRPLSLLEFASGYGCVSRHLARMPDRYALTACDIHADATAFLRHELGIAAIQSTASPHALRLPQFDVVFALSFFSHMPHATFGAWLRTLFEAVADDGILIFTTLGRVAHDKAGNPPRTAGGFWFSPVSEQEDLPVTDYGCMMVSPLYVFAQLNALANAQPLHFAEASWWHYQDLYIVRKHEAALGPPAAPAAQEALAAMRASRSWQVTAPARALMSAFRRRGRAAP